MGKASRRKGGDRTSARAARAAQVPFVGRPFAGLAGETEWVAIREILPAATATVALVGERVGEHGDGPDEATVATVLPMAWPGLHRKDGTVFVGTQSGSASGDTSRDLAGQILAARALEAGVPLLASPHVTADTPRLQDILDPSVPLVVELHDGFDFWVEDDVDIEGEAKESLDRANETIVPTKRLSALPSSYWVEIGSRSYIRVVLPDDEDPATDALARLHAAGEDALGDGTKLLGAFRASGLLIPVWELADDTSADDYEAPLTAWQQRYAAALALSGTLTADERRARSGLLSRQVTLR